MAGQLAAEMQKHCAAAIRADANIAGASFEQAEHEFKGRVLLHNLDKTNEHKRELEQDIKNIKNINNIETLFRNIRIF